MSADPFVGLPRRHFAATLRELSCRPESALELGKAAEHLVCADLILQGFRAYLSDQGLPYDIVVDLDGRLIRIQTKAACFHKNVNMAGRSPKLAYSFSARRRGKNGSSRLRDTDCDIIAFVALDIRVVAYLPIKEVGQTCQLGPPGFEFRGNFKRRWHTSIEGFPFADALERML